MNQKIDLTKVTKKVDSNVEYARQQYRLDKAKQELKMLEQQYKKSHGQSPGKKGGLTFKMQPGTAIITAPQNVF